MTLALAEIRRHPGRFAAITGALALIMFLVLVLAGLSDGLWYGATGAIRHTDADLEVFSVDSLHVLTRSNLAGSDADRVRAVAGVADVGAIGVLLAPASAGGTGQRARGLRARPAREPTHHCGWTAAVAGRARGGRRRRHPTRPPRAR
jgi:hypothetical protein